MSKEKKFLEAAENGDLNTLKEYINDGVDKETIYTYGMTVLHCTSSWGHLKIAQYLIETCHIVTEAEAYDGATALHWASGEGHLDIVQYLIETCHVSKEAKDNDGRTALLCASQYGRLNIVQYLIETCHLDQEVKDNYGWTALHCASICGHLSIVRYLIEICHVDIDARNNLGQTAYEIARKENWSNVVHYLENIPRADSTTTNLNNKESRNTSTSTDDYTLVADQSPATNTTSPPPISNTTNTKTAEKLMQMEKEFWDAAKNGNLNQVKKNINNGVAGEAKNPYGMTALHCASENGHLEIVQYLIETCRVNMEAKKNNGWTALHYASENGHLNIIQYLVEICLVNKAAKSNHGSTALHFASDNGHLEIVRYLVETCHLDQEPKNYSGETALHCASRGGHLKIVRYLIETCHVDEEVKTKDGRTALHLASAWGCLGVVQYLVETCQVDTGIRNNEGETAYDIALENTKSIVVQYLERARADSTTSNVNKKESGDTSAVSNNNSEGVAQTNEATASFVSKEEPQSEIENFFAAPVLNSDINGSTSLPLEGKASSLAANVDSIGSTDILIQNSDSNNTSPQAFHLNKSWMSKLQDENQQLIDKLKEFDSSIQFIDERRDILDLVCVEKCNTIDEQNEQNAILVSPLHRDFYLLLQRKLKCMIKSCETLSTGMVGAGGGDFRSYAARTIREKGCNVLRETKLGFFIGNAVQWSKKNLAIVPFIDSVGSVFQLIVTLKAENDRYLGVARVADFATMVCLQQYGTTSLDNAVEKLARWIVRARCGSPSCTLVEEKDEFGRYKQLMINLLADSGNTPTKEQASKAADCAFAHIMKPDKSSLLFDVLYGDSFDVGLDEALAASILGISLEELRELDSFIMMSQVGIPSNVDTNNRSRIVSGSTINIGFNAYDVVAEQESKMQKQEEMIQKQDEMMKKLSYQVAHLEKKMKQSNSRTNYDAGDGLVYANPAEQFKNELSNLQIDNVVLDQRLRDQATIINNYESRLADLEKQQFGAGRELPVIDTKRGTKKGTYRNA